MKLSALVDKLQTAADQLNIFEHVAGGVVSWLNTRD